MLELNSSLKVRLEISLYTMHLQLVMLHLVQDQVVVQQLKDFASHQQV